MPLFAAHVAISLVYIKLKLLPSGGENSIISLQLEAILLRLLSLYVCEYCVHLCVYTHTYIEIDIDISIYNISIWG